MSCAPEIVGADPLDSTAINYKEYGNEYSGQVSLIGRVKWVNPAECLEFL